VNLSAEQFRELQRAIALAALDRLLAADSSPEKETAQVLAGPGPSLAKSTRGEKHVSTKNPRAELPVSSMQS